TISALLGTSEVTTPYAIVQALHALDPREDAGPIDLVAGRLGGMAAGMVRYASLDQSRAVEKANVTGAEITANDHMKAREYNAAILTLERLALLNQRLGRFEDDTIKDLAHSVAGAAINDVLGPSTRQHAFQALINAGAVDPESEKIALKEQDAGYRR